VKRLLVVAVAGLVACGDASSTTSTSTSSGSGGATSSGPVGPGPVSASSGSTTGTGTINPDDPYGCMIGDGPSRPPSIPEGWRPWTCWSQLPECALWIPDDPATMVEPLEWEDCAAGSPAGDGCRQMTRPWWRDGGAIGATQPAVPELDRSGSATLLRFVRASLTGLGSEDSYGEWVVYELDGPATMAFRLPVQGPIECGYQDYDLSEGTWVLAPKGDNSVPIADSTLDGAMLVELGTGVVTLPFRDDLPGSSSWRAGAAWVTRSVGEKLSLHDHSFSTEVLLQDPSVDPLGAYATSAIQIVGDGVVWEVATSSQVGIRAYDPERGPHDLIRYLEDPTRGAGAPGTDGIDLVWMEGRGLGPDDFVYPERDVMTASFTTDPDALEPRRLRSDVSTALGALGDNFKVGCGYAARHGATIKDVQLVRLDDGRAWYLDHVPQVWQASSIAGMTCDEIFLTVQFWVDGRPQGSTIQRIRFDALGDGVPPD
jgi:hypothetical protein